MQFVVFVLVVNCWLAWNVNGDKYDDDYNKFLTRNFARAGDKHLDKKAEYKQVQKLVDAGDDDSDKGTSYESDSYDDDEGDEKSSDPKDDVDDSDHWYYSGKQDYERIKALSERQVAELVKTPGNCKHYEKDGMVCATCEDPDTGDNSESCSYASQPKDNRVAFLSKKSHNYKKPQPVEAEEADENDDDESEDQEEEAVNPPPKGPKPLKTATESDDADYGAYKLAGDNDDVADYDEPKFAQIKAEPKDKDFEILPDTEFKTRDVSQAFTDFKAKDWSKCNKIMKGDMTCYYCKDQKGAVQEECMFISASNPKNFKVEHRQVKNFSKKPTGTTKKPFTPLKKPIVVAPVKSQALKNEPEYSEKKQKFARLRVGRPLMPTKASVKSTAEPLVTPTTNLSPLDHDDYTNSPNKKTIKRTVSFRKHLFDSDHYEPAESQAIHYETHVRHFK